ncbi:hypothetical protein [Spiroplasma endosymbiont of Polydrusus pterygomalis]|uniref:hypothetical protein n=1 Tax=Spiroplasma endosymbiont of Polydrusus pterygomalis TaxID=3139327 RepID=UPI003CCAE2E4
MNNNEPNFNGGNENNFNSFGNSNEFENNNFENKNPAVTPLTDSIKVPNNTNDFQTEANPAFNSSYISQKLGINSTSMKPQHNKPIYQPIIYQPFVMPMMMGYPQMFPCSMMPQFPMMMGYPQMSKYPGMLTYPSVVGPEVEQQEMQQYAPGQESGKHQMQDNGRHFSFMNPDLMQQQPLNGDFDDNFGGGNTFGSNSDFGQETSNFGPTPYFNAAPSFSSAPDFAPSNVFNNNSNVLSKMDSTKMPFQYEEETSKRKLPVWVIVLIVMLVFLILAIITIVILYFNLEAVHDLINSWFGFELPFEPWF